jgi:pimeloyl-ACP methyl ester carboxylesterase
MDQIKNLLLLPGLLCDRELWGAQIKALSGLVEIFVGDMTGHVDMKQLASSILETAPPEFALAGFSMGGYCALEIYQQAPERVQKLALIDTSARADNAEQIERRRALIDLCQAEKLDQILDHLLPVFINRLDDQSLVQNIREMAARIGCDAFIDQQKTIMSRDDKRAMLKNIISDTLVLCGSQDQLTLPEFSSELAKGIFGARLVIVENSGHFAPMEQPQRVIVELTSWLSG